MVKETKSIRNRVKTGCLKCREVHKKCDELKPKCLRCVKRNENCIWPSLNGRFVNRVVTPVNPTREESLKVYSKRLLETLNNNESQRTPMMSTTSPKLHNIMNMGEPDGAIPDQRYELLSPSRSISHSDSIMGHDPQSTVPFVNHFSTVEPPNELLEISTDLSPFLHYRNLHRTFRDYIFTNVASSSMNSPADVLAVDFTNILQSPMPELLRDFNTQLTGEQPTLNAIYNGGQITEREKLDLYKTYLYEIAPWLDMFDGSRQFGTVIPLLATNSDALFYTILTIASRQKEQRDKNYSPNITLSLYRESLRYLIPTVKDCLDTSIICACVILCVLELMSSSPKTWRYHLEGCASLFKTHNIHGFGDPLQRGLFWCYARMDVISAVIGEQPTLIPSEKWLPNNCSVSDLKSLFTSFGNQEDMYANYMVFLCARVLNLIANDKENYALEWKQVWDEVGEWHQNRPIQLMPIMETEQTPFPGILYMNGPAISSNQLYHMTVILLTQNKPRAHKIVFLDHIRSPVWHAKRICAISLHNEHHGCWNNALQPLWIAGQLLSSKEEHEIVLNLLHKIESTTGWQLGFRARDLEAYWNGDNSPSSYNSD